MNIVHAEMVQLFHKFIISLFTTNRSVQNTASYKYTIFTIIIPQKNDRILHFLLIIKEKVGVHRSKCTPTEILSLPTVSAFLLVLLLLCLLLLFLTQTFTDRAFFSFLMEQICHIPFAVVHHQGIVLIPIRRGDHEELHRAVRNRKSLRAGVIQECAPVFG